MERLSGDGGGGSTPGAMSGMRRSGGEDRATSLEGAVQLHEKMGPQAFLPDFGKLVRASLHNLDHVLHDPQDLFVVVVRESRLRPEIPRSLDLLDFGAAAVVDPVAVRETAGQSTDW